ncbi:MAG: hypothetical protein RH917_08575 [Lacipirellulaceae bacterium]
MSTIESPSSATYETEEFDYRALSTGAVVAAIFGGLSTLIFLAARTSFASAAMMAPFGILALVVGFVSYRKIRSQSETLSGGGIAKLGIALGLVSLLGGLGYAGYVEATEVREGYQRTSFIDFAPDQSELDLGDPVPDDIDALDGKPVFIKGFIRPDSVQFSKGVRDFLLVRDNNECCYGDASKVKYYDQLAVHVKDKKGIEVSRGLFRVHGTLHVAPSNSRRGPGYPVFSLEAEHVD